MDQAGEDLDPYLCSRGSREGMCMDATLARCPLVVPSSSINSTAAASDLRPTTSAASARSFSLSYHTHHLTCTQSALCAGAYVVALCMPGPRNAEENARTQHS